MEETELMRRKYSKRFDMFDSDADGLVGYRDFLQVAIKLRQRFHHGHPSIANQVLDGYRWLWHSLALGCDQDSAATITRAQFVVVCSADDLLRLRYRLCLADRTAIDMCAVDTAYLLTLDETVDVFSAMGVSPADTADIRTLLDTHVEQPLRVADVCRLVRSFYTSQDPEAPGNRIFGRLPSATACSPVLTR